MDILFYLIEKYGYPPILLIGTLSKKARTMKDTPLISIHRHDQTM